MSGAHITVLRKGLPLGHTKIVRLDEIALNVGMEFGILKLAFGKRFKGLDKNCETQLVLLSGQGLVEIGKSKYRVSRLDVFPVIDIETNTVVDDRGRNPWAFDIPAGCPWSVAAYFGEMEIAVIKAENNKIFEPVVVRPEEVPSEQRGEGRLAGAMHRVVKAILGDPNAPYRPPESNLVVGEVINFPGRWSSYPPHYHPHSEIYYYRFDKPQGFGLSCVDEASAPVVRSHDVVKIMNCVGHAQVAAPGYAMWYLWVVRQIEGNRYEGNPPFKFFQDHEWTMLNPAVDAKEGR